MVDGGISMEIADAKQNKTSLKYEKIIIIIIKVIGPVILATVLTAYIRVRLNTENMEGIVESCYRNE